MEYAQALRPRYRKASREEKSKMLDEFTKVTGFHRKAATRLLNRVSRLTPGKRRGRQRKYGSAVAEALKEVWEATFYYQTGESAEERHTHQAASISTTSYISSWQETNVTNL